MTQLTLDSLFAQAESTTEQIKLTKVERQNSYVATCTILLDGKRIGTMESQYGYTPQGQLRISLYLVKLELFGQNNFSKWHKQNCFKVNGRWETKNAIYTHLGAESTYRTHTNAFPTSKAAKTAALAFIKQFVD